jgi:hypothetical protein
MDCAMTRPVRRRHVFYIPGFDPCPPRRYRELYRREGQAQAAISGYALALQPGARPDRWTVEARMDGARVHTTIEVLCWRDLVRGAMAGSIAATYGAMLRTVWVYVASGAFWRLARLRKGPVLAALYPVVALTGQAVLALTALVLVVHLTSGPLGGGVAAALGAALAIWLLRRFRAADHRVLAHYLMHDFALVARHAGAYAPDLEDRLTAFRGRVLGAMDTEVDEVLLVGHSSGAHLAISVAADVLRVQDPRGEGPCLSLLTLGQAVPMVSFLPDAHRLRRDLAALAVAGQIAWVDVSAPGDGCCFALCDPVAVSGVAPPEQVWPLVISAAYSNSLSPERRAAMKWRLFRRHIQYLCAFDRPQGYDYFSITAGPRTLGARFAGRRASAQCRRSALSGHVGIAA